MGCGQRLMAKEEESSSREIRGERRFLWVGLRWAALGNGSVNTVRSLVRLQRPVVRLREALLLHELQNGALVFGPKLLYVPSQYVEAGSVRSGHDGPRVRAVGVRRRLADRCDPVVALPSHVVEFDFELPRIRRTPRVPFNLLQAPVRSVDADEQEQGEPRRLW